MENLRYDEKGKVIPEMHFGFILNFIEFDEELEFPIRLIEDHYIDRANADQVHIIKQVLNGNLSERRYRAAEFMYENDLYFDNEQAFSVRKLDSTNWKYLVINNTKTEDGNQKMIDLLRCCFMVGRIRLAAQTWGSRLVGTANTVEFEDAIRNYFSQIKIQPIEIKPTKITKRTIEILEGVYEMYKRIESSREYDFIKNAIEYYRESDSFSDNQKIKTVELFVILELLLTHEPIDKGDSINRQLSSKINLVANRFNYPVDLDEFFGKK